MAADKHPVFERTASRFLMDLEELEWWAQHDQGSWQACEEHGEALRRSSKIRVRHRKARIPDSVRWAVWERDNFTCQHCGVRRYLSIDHVVPESKGGTLTMDNLQTLCVGCNSRKGARDA